MAPSKKAGRKTNGSKRFSLEKVKDKVLYECSECGKTFMDNSAYHLHLRLHSEVFPYSCDRCDYKCKVKKYLSRHVKKVHNKANGPECPVCGKVFHYDSNLKNHMRVHTGEKPFKCTVCKKAFSSSYCLSMHKLIHTQEKPYHCKFCPYACRDSSTLRKHQERHMGILKEYPCNKCKKILKSSMSLRIHIDEVHYGLDTRKFGCEQCDKAFKTKTSLNMHVRTVHDRVSRTECEICGRSVAKNNVTRHLQSHVDIRPYQCSFATCGKTFKDRSTLRKHSRIHYPECHYQCDKCDRKFSRKVRLREHKMKHATAGGYTCDYCGVSYVRKSFITFHIRTKHGPNGEKYICDKCGLTTYTKKCIILHLRYGHGTAQDRKCNICSEVVTTSNLLKEHYFELHQIKFIVQNSCRKDEQRMVIKDEPMELNAEFEFNYDVQKIEMDEHVSDREYEDPETTIAYSTQVLEEDMCRTMGDQDEFHQLFARQILNQPARQVNIPEPEYVDAETTLAYSEKVLEEDISRSLLERGKQEAPETSFDEFFLQQVLSTPKPKELPRKKIAKTDKRKIASVKKSVEKMLAECRNRRAVEGLEAARRAYNERIQAAHAGAARREPTKITYFKKSANVQDNNNSLHNNITTNHNDTSDNDSSQDDQPLNRLRNKTVNDISQNHNSRNDTVQNVNVDDGSENISHIDIVNDISQNHNSSNDTVQNDNVDDGSENISHNDIVNDISQNHNSSNDTVQNGNVDDGLENISYNDNVNGISQNHNCSNDTVQNGNVDDGSEYISHNDNNESDSLQNDETDDVMSQNDTSDMIQHDNHTSSLANDESANHVSQNHISNNKTTQSKPVDEKLQNGNNTPQNDHNNDTSQNAKPDNEISENDKITSDITEVENEKDKIDDDDDTYDIPIAQRITRTRTNKIRKRKAVRYDRDSDNSDNVCSDTESANKKGKITFDGHECYICFKIFKTKNDLKMHCSEHFDVCNEKMLKKCPFCGYVTNLNIKRHVELAHKINITYAYGHITEKKNSDGSKYVLELNNDRELEVIPSVSNLNKIACRKNDEKIRHNKNLFFGKTKLVKKGGEWVVEKQAVRLNDQYLLPEFTEEEYTNLKIEGDGYVDRIKKLSHLAKKRGIKMLYPCGGCEKICQTLSALKLHNRKHEVNPKRFKPKNWVNRHIEYKTLKRKSKKNNKIFKKPVREIPVKISVPSNNRFASPKPVKNKHKCDKQLIEFYKSNIKGGDIEFWQFLKIFNKMSRENVNDFADLENRNDLHFGVHCLSTQQPVDTEIVPGVTEEEPVHTESVPLVTEKELVDTEKETVHTESEPVPKNISKNRRNVSQKFTRAIMISKKEYMRRQAIKNQMRKRLEETRV